MNRALSQVLATFNDADEFFSARDSYPRPNRSLETTQPLTNLFRATHTTFFGSKRSRPSANTNKFPKQGLLSAQETRQNVLVVGESPVESTTIGDAKPRGFGPHCQKRPSN